MLGSEILDVVIGMIFIFLLLSLICSAVNELIEAMLKNRAGDLERGIRELLNDPSGTGLTEKIYKHPLVSSLYRGTYSSGGKKTKKTKSDNAADLPSYIPSRNFALALMDIIAPAKVPDKAATGAARQASRSGAAGATPPAPAPAGTTPAAPISVQSLRDAIETNPLLNDTVRNGLLTLVDAAGEDAAKARQNIEGWFNSSMDRVSGWYKRRSQIIVLVLGLLITILVNADAITIVRSLSRDPAMRNSLVAAAQEYAKANASPSPTPSPATTPSPNGSPSATPTASPAPNSSPSVKPTAAAASSVAAPSPTPPATTAPPNAAASPGASPSAIVQAACKKDENSPVCLQCKDEASPECRVAKNLEQIQSLGLPIGWNDRTTPHDFWDFLLKLLGWLLTAAAISLGAPFWFDLLNKFIVIRSTVKPREKSHEEESKD